MPDCLLASGETLLTAQEIEPALRAVQEDRNFKTRFTRKSKITMETLIFTGMFLVIIYQIYSTHKNVNKLLNQVEELKNRINELGK